MHHISHHHGHGSLNGGCQRHCDHRHGGFGQGPHRAGRGEPGTWAGIDRQDVARQGADDGRGTPCLDGGFGARRTATNAPWSLPGRKTAAAPGLLRDRCPECDRHCPLDALECARGEEALKRRRQG